MNRGARVLRGPDWKWEEEDNGIGTLGTIIELRTADDQVKVQWDNGMISSYRSGSENDLKIFDNAPAGIKTKLLKYLSRY